MSPDRPPKNRRPVVPPPVPAPYLAGIPSLPDQALARLANRHEQDGRGRVHTASAQPPPPLSAAEEQKFDRAIRRRCRKIRLARRAYEQEHGVRIAPEPTPVIAQLSH